MDAVTQLPIGIQDSMTAIDEDRCVDECMLFGQVLDEARKAPSMHTRPRMCGKSLNLSKMDAFFNIKQKETDDMAVLGYQSTTGSLVAKTPHPLCCVFRIQMPNPSSPWADMR